MFAGRKKENSSEGGPGPLRAHNRNRPGRRPLVVRRFDQTRLKELVVPPRPKRWPRREVNKDENGKFESELATKYEAAPPPYVDRRYQIPTQDDRVDLGRKTDLPRRVRRDIIPSMAEAHGFDGDVVRERLENHGIEAFSTIQNSTWRRCDWTQARHVEVRVDDVPMDLPMPTHFMRISTDSSTEEQNLVTPVHSAFVRAHWGRLGGLPEFDPLDICTPITADGEKLTESEFARGDVPLINVRVHNLQTMPHIIAYMYQRNPGALLQQLIGPLSEPIHPYANKEQTMEQREAEWVISQKLGANYDSETLRVHAWFIHDLVENGNCVGMEDSGFWWACDTAMRIIVDALVVQDRFTS